MKGFLSSDASNGARLEFWKRFCAGISPVSLLISITVMLFVLFLAGMSHRWLAASDSPLVQFIINGESLVLNAEDGEALSRDFDGRLEGLERDAEQQLESWMETALAEAGEQYQAAGEHYLDWYFSATGSYARLGASLAGNLDPWIADQIEGRLVGPSGVEQALSSLHAEYRERLLEGQQGLLAEALGDVYLHYSGVAIPAAEIGSRSMVTLNLDRVVAAADHLKDSETLLWTTPPPGIGLLGGAGVTAVLMARPAMARASGIVKRFVARLGLAATRSLTAGGAAAAGTAATGPGAVVAGTVTAGTVIAMTAGTEYIALVRQEEEHRPAMEGALVEAWEDLEAELRMAVSADRQAWTTAVMEQLQRSAGHEADEAGLPDAYRILQHL